MTLDKFIDEAYRLSLQTALDVIGEDMKVPDYIDETNSGDVAYHAFCRGTNKAKAEIRENIKKLMQ